MYINEVKFVVFSMLVLSNNKNGMLKSMILDLSASVSNSVNFCFRYFKLCYCYFKICIYVYIYHIFKIVISSVELISLSL